MGLTVAHISFWVYEKVLESIPQSLYPTCTVLVLTNISRAVTMCLPNRSC